MVVRMLLGTNRLNPDLWIANSDLVKRRIMTSWDIDESDIVVCYPPVDVDSYDHTLDINEEYYFHLGRLDEMKRVDEIVEAFKGLEHSLKIAGEGPALDSLREQAGDNVEFLGYVSEEKKHKLMAGAKAFIFNAENEDFGLVPIESMAAGTPVLGVEEGFTQEQIYGGLNGHLYERGVEKLRNAIHTFEEQGTDWNVKQLTKYADQFSVERFEQEMREYVKMAETNSEIGGPKYD